MKTVTFYNNWHAGDVHVSRSFVREMIRQLPDHKFKYVHSNSKRLLLDLPIEHVYAGPPTFDRRDDGFELWIDTWYGARGGAYHTKWANFQSLVNLFRFEFEYSRIKFDEDPLTYLPSYDWSKYQTSRIDEHFAKRNKMSVFICNCSCLSGQMPNHDMTWLIMSLAEEHPDWDFYVTNVCQINQPNVHYTPNVIGALESDLVENGYLSTKCDVIVGRASGPYTFAVNRDNAMDPSKTFVCFSVQSTVAYWCPMKAKIIWQPDWTKAKGTIEGAMHGHDGRID